MPDPYRPPDFDPGREEQPRSWAVDPRDLFGVAVRVLGLYLTIESLAQLVGLLLPANGFTPMDYMLSFALTCLPGLVLLFGANFVVRASYGFAPPWVLSANERG